MNARSNKILSLTLKELPRTQVSLASTWWLRLLGPFLCLCSASHLQLPPLLFSHSVLSDSATPWTVAHEASLFFPDARSLLKLVSIESVMPSNQLILCRRLLLPPSILPSIRVFSNESVLLIGWPEYWSFSFSISPSNEYSGLISFRMDWFDLLAVQGTLNSLF